MIGQRFSHYRVVERIGAGGMGEVYRARDEHLPRDVAIKILPAGTLADDQVRKRFRKEAETLSQLNHQHIATIHDFDTQDDVDFLVMEYVEGTTLAEKLADGALPVAEVLRIGSEIAEAFDEAHHRGIVHRDLKPKNIGLTLKGQVKVLDFGLARVLKPSTDASTTDTLTGATGLAGTLPYMAPEQLRGAPADHRSDLYALGVCLYEMSTGKRPFQQELATALTDDILHAIPVSPSRLRPEIPTGLEHVIVKCLEKDPDLRCQSAREVLTDLRRMTTPSLAQEMLGMDTSRQRKQRLNRRRSSLLAGLVLLVGGIVITFWNVGDLRKRFLGRPELGLIESVVALPSEVFGAEDDRFLTDAIPRTLSTYLTQVQGLETKLPPTSIEMDKVGGDLDKIAKAYGVSAFVLSTVTASSEKLVLNLQLVEAQTRRLIWSREYNGDRQGFLDLVHAAAEGLREAMRPAAAQLPQAVAPSEPEIWFQRGLHYSSRYNHLHGPEDFDRALGAFEKVIELNPRRADAVAEIGNLYILKWEAGSQEALSQVASWANRALELDPRTARAWDLLSYYEVRSESGSKETALLASLRAVSLAPSDAGCQMGLHIVLGETGSERLCREAALEAARLDPLYHHPLIGAGFSTALLGRPGEALEMVDRALALEPDMPIALAARGMHLVALGHREDARALLPRVEALVVEGRLPESFSSNLRDLLAVESRADGWRQAMQRMRSESTGALGSAWVGFLAIILARNEETEAALATIVHSSSSQVPSYDWLMLCPDLAPLRQDPRFEKIASESRAQFERLLQIFAEARSRNEFPAYLEKPLADLLVDLHMSDHR